MKSAFISRYCQAQVQVQVPGQVQKVQGPRTQTWTCANQEKYNRKPQLSQAH